MKNKKHILVINDASTTKLAFELAFSNSGYALTTLDKKEDCIEKIKKNNYHLVFIDLNLPDTSDITLLQQIRTLSIILPIYIVTIFHKEFLMALDEVRKIGLPFQLLRKPIGQIELLALAQSALEHPAQKIKMMDIAT